jgi:hypothetical protein
MWPFVDPSLNCTVNHGVGPKEGIVGPKEVDEERWLHWHQCCHPRLDSSGANGGEPPPTYSLDATNITMGKERSILLQPAHAQG